MLENCKKYLSINLFSFIGWLSLFTWITFSVFTFFFDKNDTGYGGAITFNMFKLLAITGKVYFAILGLVILEFILRKFSFFKFTIKYQNKFLILFFNLGLYCLFSPLLGVLLVMYSRFFIDIPIFFAIFYILNSIWKKL